MSVKYNSEDLKNMVLETQVHESVILNKAR